jgi:hypothetical protein
LPPPETMQLSGHGTRQRLHGRRSTRLGKFRSAGSDLYCIRRASRSRLA